MDRTILIKLFDIYKDLLTDREQEIFSYYYEEDLSLMEIATNLDISRSAVSKVVNNVTNKLNDYENKLHIYYKKQDILRLLEQKDYNKIKELLN